MRTDNAQPANDSDHVTQTIKSQRTACCSSYHSVTTKKMRRRGRGRGRETTGQRVQEPAATDATQSASSSPRDFQTRSRSRSGSVESRVSQASQARHGRGKTGKDKDKRDKQDFKLSEEEEELMITFLEENECIWNKNIQRIRSVCSACIRRWSIALRACPASF